MDTVEKLKTINYVCRTCDRLSFVNQPCHDRSGFFLMSEEERFEGCEYLRNRVRRINEVLNNTVYSEEIKSMSDPARVAYYAGKRAEGKK